MLEMLEYHVVPILIEKVILKKKEYSREKY